MGIFVTKVQYLVVLDNCTKNMVEQTFTLSYNIKRLKAGVVEWQTRGP